MKKVLLSLSMLAAVMSVSAQTLVPVYGGNPKNIKDSVNSEVGFAAFEPGLGETVPADFTVTEVTDVTTGNIYLKLHGTGEYYVWGTSNGNFKSVGTGLNPLGYAGTNLGYVALRVKAASTNPKSKLKIGFITATDAKTFSGELQEQGAFGVDESMTLSSSWEVYNIQLSTLVLENAVGDKLDANGAVTTDPTKYVHPTTAQVQNFGQINVILNVQSCTWNPNGTDPVTGNPGVCIVTDETSDVSVDDIYLSQNKLTTIPVIPVITATKSAAANIASTKVYPNPSTSSFTAEVSLINAASTTVILSDMMGKQISSKSVDNNGQANFETAGLSSGIYTVTYVIDGTPAKSELVVVK